MLMIAGMDRVDIKNNPGSDKSAFTIWFAGCSIKCGGCHNPRLQDVESGSPYTVGNIISIMQMLKMDEYDLVLLGGEPLEQEYHDLLLLCKMAHEGGHRIWLYTGYEFERIPDDLLKYLYWVKCGRYIGERENPGKSFPASPNQRVLVREGNEFLPAIYNIDISVNINI